MYFLVIQILSGLLFRLSQLFFDILYLCFDSFDQNRSCLNFVLDLCFDFLNQNRVCFDFIDLCFDHLYLCFDFLDLGIVFWTKIRYVSTFVLDLCFDFLDLLFDFLDLCFFSTALGLCVDCARPMIRIFDRNCVCVDFLDLCFEFILELCFHFARTKLAFFEFLDCYFDFLNFFFGQSSPMFWLFRLKQGMSRFCAPPIIHFSQPKLGMFLLYRPLFRLPLSVFWLSWLRYCFSGPKSGMFRLLRSTYVSTSSTKIGYVSTLLTFVSTSSTGVLTFLT